MVVSISLRSATYNCFRSAGASCIHIPERRRNGSIPKLAERVGSRAHAIKASIPALLNESWRAPLPPCGFDASMSPRSSSRLTLLPKKGCPTRAGFQASEAEDAVPIDQVLVFADRPGPKLMLPAVAVRYAFQTIRHQIPCLEQDFDGLWRFSHFTPYTAPEACDWGPKVFPRSESFDAHGELVNYRRPCLAHDFVLGIRASRTTDCADNIALVDQWYAASRRNDSIEREQIVEMHKLDTVLEDLRWPPEGHGCSRLVFRNLNGGEHRAVHSLEGNQVTAGIGYCYVHFPIPFLGLCRRGMNNRLGPI